jgi:hypothetical protein
MNKTDNPLSNSATLALLNNNSTKPELLIELKAYLKLIHKDQTIPEPVKLAFEAILEILKK